MNIQIPQYAAFVLDRLRWAGFEGYCVGGCVRDTLLGRMPEDWDVTTNALPHQVMEIFSNERVIETGIAHGTVTVLAFGEPVEVTTYRIDGEYTDGRHPDGVVFTRSLRDDLARRDFTINALAYCPHRGIVDFFDGLGDLSRRVIRCVGDPDRRFGEDALRILRALRFSATLGFAIEPNSANSLRHYRGMLAQISAERIASELERLVCGQAADRTLEAFPEVLQQVIPGLSHSPKGLDKLPPEPALRFAWLLLPLSPEQARDTLSALRFSTALRRDVEALRTYLGEPAPAQRPDLLRLLNRAGPQNTRRVLLLKAAHGEDCSGALSLLDRILSEGACWSLRTLAVSGSDLIAAGFPPGRALGELLDRLLAEVIAGRLPNQPDALLQFARSCA